MGNSKREISSTFNNSCSERSRSNTTCHISFDSNANFSSLCSTAISSEYDTLIDDCISVNSKDICFSQMDIPTTSIKISKEMNPDDITEFNNDAMDMSFCSESESKDCDGLFDDNEDLSLPEDFESENKLVMDIIKNNVCWGTKNNENDIETLRSCEQDNRSDSWGFGKENFDCKSQDSFPMTWNFDENFDDISDEQGSDVQIITPKKTVDITKIKGWRKKQFTIEKSSQYNFSVLKETHFNSVDVKERMENGTDIISLGKTMDDIDDDNDIIVIDDMDGQEKSVGNGEGEEKMGIIKEEFENNDRSNTDCAFVCDKLDNFLDQEAELKINYEIPHLYAEYGIKLTSEDLVSRPKFSPTADNVKSLNWKRRPEKIKSTIPSIDSTLVQNKRTPSAPHKKSNKDKSPSPGKAKKTNSAKKIIVPLESHVKIDPPTSKRGRPLGGIHRTPTSNKAQANIQHSNFNDIGDPKSLIAERFGSKSLLGHCNNNNNKNNSISYNNNNYIESSLTNLPLQDLRVCKFGMVLYPGPFTPLNSIIQFHLKKIRSYRTSVDEKWARFAASAVYVKNTPVRRKRMVLPLMCCFRCNSEIGLKEPKVQRLSTDSADASGDCTILYEKGTEDISSPDTVEIKKLVQNLVNKVSDCDNLKTLGGERRYSTRLSSKVKNVEENATISTPTADAIPFDGCSSVDEDRSERPECESENSQFLKIDRVFTLGEGATQCDLLPEEERIWNDELISNSENANNLDSEQHSVGDIEGITKNKQIVGNAKVKAKKKQPVGKSKSKSKKKNSVRRSDRISKLNTMKNNPNGKQTENISLDRQNNEDCQYQVGNVSSLTIDINNSGPMGFNDNITRLFARKLNEFKSTQNIPNSIDNLKCLKPNVLELIKLNFIKENFLSGYINIWYIKQEESQKSRAFITFSMNPPVKGAINLKRARVSKTQLPNIIREIITRGNLFDTNEFAILYCDGKAWEIQGSVNFSMDRSEDAPAFTEKIQIFELPEKILPELPSFTNVNDFDAKSDERPTFKWWVMDMTQKYSEIIFKVGKETDTIPRSRIMKFTKSMVPSFICFNGVRHVRLLGISLNPRFWPFSLIGPYEVDENHDLSLKLEAEVVPFEYSLPFDRVQPDLLLKRFVSSLIQHSWRHCKKVVGMWLYDKTDTNETSFMEVRTMCKRVEKYEPAVEHDYTLSQTSDGFCESKAIVVQSSKDTVNNFSEDIFLVPNLPGIGYVKGVLHSDNTVTVEHPLKPSRMIKSRHMGEFLTRIIKRRIAFFPTDLTLRWSIVKDAKLLGNMKPLDKYCLGRTHVLCKKGVFYLLSMTKEKVKELGLDESFVVNTIIGNPVVQEISELKKLGKLLLKDEERTLDMYQILKLALVEIEKLENEDMALNQLRIVTEKEREVLWLKYARIVESSNVDERIKNSIIRDIKRILESRSIRFRGIEDTSFRRLEAINKYLEESFNFPTETPITNSDCEVTTLEKETNDKEDDKVQENDEIFVIEEKNSNVDKVAVQNLELKITQLRELLSKSNSNNAAIHEKLSSRLNALSQHLHNLKSGSNKSTCFRSTGHTDQNHSLADTPDQFYSQGHSGVSESEKTRDNCDGLVLDEKNDEIDRIGLNKNSTNSKSPSDNERKQMSKTNLNNYSGFSKLKNNKSENSPLKGSVNVNNIRGVSILKKREAEESTPKDSLWKVKQVEFGLVQQPENGMEGSRTSSDVSKSNANRHPIKGIEKKLHFISKEVSVSPKKEISKSERTIILPSIGSAKKMPTDNPFKFKSSEEETEFPLFVNKINMGFFKYRRNKLIVGRSKSHNIHRTYKCGEVIDGRKTRADRFRTLFGFRTIRPKPVEDLIPTNNISHGENDCINVDDSDLIVPFKKILDEHQFQDSKGKAS